MCSFDARNRGSTRLPLKMNERIGKTRAVGIIPAPFSKGSKLATRWGWAAFLSILMLRWHRLYSLRFRRWIVYEESFQQTSYNDSLDGFYFHDASHDGWIHGGVGGGRWVGAEGRCPFYGNYALYDQVVASKFLTSATQLVVIERMTRLRLSPNQEGPTTAEAFRNRSISMANCRQI